MSGFLCCLPRAPIMGAALSQPQDGDGDVEQISPPTMADVIRERKKKAGGATLGTLRRRIAAAARRPRDGRPDKGCEHARLIRSVVQNWRLAEVVVLQQQLTAAAALRDLCAQADLARAPAASLHAAVMSLHTKRWWCDVELVGGGWSIPAHRAILSARCAYFRRLLHHCAIGSGICRVSLSGAGAGWSRTLAEHVITALYCGAHKMEQSAKSDDELESINGDTTSNWRSACECGSRAPASLLQRLGARLDSLQRDMKYLLDSGEYADASLSFRGGAPSAPLPCHRSILAARSRLFRSIMSRHAPAVTSGAAGTTSGAVVVDERVLPRRFAPALLHAAYTDQVDLTLIGRPASPSATTNNNSGSSWSSLGRSGQASKATSASMLEDAFQLYEIASFVEMPIAVQGCEDAIIEALTPETLPAVLRWAAGPAASQWVHRQAMRYLVDEFPSCLSPPSAARLPPAALRAALKSPFLQCSEQAALRAAQRWAASRESPTLGAGRRRGARRAPGASSRHALKPLLAHIRTEHIPPTNDVLQQAIRRGLVSEACPAWASADAWLGRGLYRPARCLLPYLDALQTLVEGVRVPEAELARVRRAKCLTRMPDTLYMVGSGREPPQPALSPSERAQLLAALPGALRASLLARCAELRRGAAARRAASTHAEAVRIQIALRAVRERSLPDACAELLLPDMEDGGGGGAGASESNGEDAVENEDWDCSRSEDGAQGGLNDEPRTSRSHDTLEGNRHRELPALVSEGQMQRGGNGTVARLSRCVPDVLAPNANTHLLNYPAHTDLAGPAAPVLQLDLGDGATHSPRPGSRAQRQAKQQREQAQLSCGAQPRDDDLRVAETSSMRAYSYNPRASPTPPLARPRAHRGHLGTLGPLGPLELGGPFSDRASFERLSNDRLERNERLGLSNERLERNGTLERNTATLERLSGTLERLSGAQSMQSERSLNSQIDRLSGTLERLSGTLSVQSGTLEFPTPHRSSVGSYSSNLEGNNSFAGFALGNHERGRYNTIERSHSNSTSVGSLEKKDRHALDRRTPERNSSNIDRNTMHNYIDRGLSGHNPFDLVGGCKREPCLQGLGVRREAGGRESVPLRDLSTGSLHRDGFGGLPHGGLSQGGLCEPGISQGQRGHSYRRRSREREAVMLSIHQGVGSASPSPNPSPITVNARQRLSRQPDGSERRSPRHTQQYSRYTLEASFPGSASSSRGPSPNNYA